MNFKKIMKWCIFIFWLFLIFYLSHQSGGESQNLSNHFVQMIESLFSVSWLSHFIIDLSFFVRKSAHFWLYFFLGVITLALFLEYHFSFSKRMFFSFLFCFFYACSDEIHQLFVIGRSGRFLDVLIDSCGALFGILFFYACYFLLKKRLKH